MTAAASLSGSITRNDLCAGNDTLYKTLIHNTRYQVYRLDGLFTIEEVVNVTLHSSKGKHGANVTSFMKLPPSVVRLPNFHRRGKLIKPFLFFIWSDPIFYSSCTHHIDTLQDRVEQGKVVARTHWKQHATRVGVRYFFWCCCCVSLCVLHRKETNQLIDPHPLIISQGCWAQYVYQNNVAVVPAAPMQSHTDSTAIPSARFSSLSRHKWRTFLLFVFIIVFFFFLSLSLAWCYSID